MLHNVARIDVVRLRARLAESSFFYTKLEYSKICDYGAVYRDKIHVPHRRKDPNRRTVHNLCSSANNWTSTQPTYSGPGVMLAFKLRRGKYGGASFVGHVGWETEGFKGPLTVEYL